MRDKNTNTNTGAETMTSTIKTHGQTLEMLTPEYHAGSQAKGWFQYRVVIQTARVNRRQSTVAVGPKHPTRQAAKTAAMAEADQRAEEFAKELSEND